jgi:general secretion pathway protein A
MSSYLDYWGLREPPFDELHDSRFFVDEEDLRVARAKLRHAIQQGQRAAALTGEVGSGKSALARKLLGELNRDNWVAAYVPTPFGETLDVLAGIAAALGATGSDPVSALETALETLDAEDRHACVAIDEVHAITRPDLLEALRSLLNLEIDGHMPLTLVLIGQDSMMEMLRAASGFDQRLSLTVRVPLLGPEACKHYILARLKLAGCSRGIFTRSAAERIVDLAQGIPRNINRICELALTVGYGFGMKKIREDVIGEVARELNLIREPIVVEVPERSESAAPVLPVDTGIQPVGEDILASTKPQPRLRNGRNGAGGPLFTDFSVDRAQPRPASEGEPEAAGEGDVLASVGSKAPAEGEADDDVLAGLPPASNQDDILGSL